jgi:voltage-gated potassium channel Kch
VVENWWIVLGGALGLYIAKGAVLSGLARLFKSSHGDAIRIASVIGQGGEFAFVMITLAIGVGLFEGELPAILSAIVTFSMILTPLAMAGADRLIERMGGPETLDDMKGVEHADRAKVIVAGFGRVGQVIARIMAMQDVDVTLIDNSPRRIRIARTFGTEVYFGDARRLDMLETAGAADADLLFLCISDRDGAPESVIKLKERFPNLKIFAETYDRFSEVDMRRAGADFVVRQTYESAIALAAAGLDELGEGDDVDDVIAEFRRHDMERLDLETEHGTAKALDILRERYELSDEA